MCQDQYFSPIEPTNFLDIYWFRSKAFDHSSYKYVYQEYCEQKKSINRSFKFDYYNDIDKLLSLNVAPWSAFFKKKFIIDNNIFFNNLKVCNDRSFNSICILHKPMSYFYDEYIYNHRINRVNSLIGERHKNFENLIQSYNIINDRCLSSMVESKIKDKILTRELTDILLFYSNFKKLGIIVGDTYKSYANTDSFDIYAKNLSLDHLHTYIEFKYNIKVPRKFVEILKQILNKLSFDDFFCLLPQDRYCKIDDKDLVKLKARCCLND